MILNFTQGDPERDIYVQQATTYGIHKGKNKVHLLKLSHKIRLHVFEKKRLLELFNIANNNLQSVLFHIFINSNFILQMTELEWVEIHTIRYVLHQRILFSVFPLPRGR